MLWRKSHYLIVGLVWVCLQAEHTSIPAYHMVQQLGNNVMTGAGAAASKRTCRPSSRR